jgi:hypothetical protein
MVNRQYILILLIATIRDYCRPDSHGYVMLCRVLQGL